MLYSVSSLSVRPLSHCAAYVCRSRRCMCCMHCRCCVNLHVKAMYLVRVLTAKTAQHGMGFWQTAVRYLCFASYLPGCLWSDLSAAWWVGLPMCCAFFCAHPYIWEPYKFRILSAMWSPSDFASHSVNAPDGMLKPCSATCNIASFRPTMMLHHNSLI